MAEFLPSNRNVIDNIEINDVCVFEDKFGEKYTYFVRCIKKTNTQINITLNEAKIEYETRGFDRKPICYKKDNSVFFDLKQIWKPSEENTYKLFWEVK